MRGILFSVEEATTTGREAAVAPSNTLPLGVEGEEPSSEAIDVWILKTIENHCINDRRYSLGKEVMM